MPRTLDGWSLVAGRGEGLKSKSAFWPYGLEWNDTPSLLASRAGHGGSDWRRGGPAPRAVPPAQQGARAAGRTRALDPAHLGQPPPNPAARQQPSSQKRPLPPAHPGTTSPSRSILWQAVSPSRERHEEWELARGLLPARSSSRQGASLRGAGPVAAARPPGLTPDIWNCRASSSGVLGCCTGVDAGTHACPLASRRGRDPCAPGLLPCRTGRGFDGGQSASAGCSAMPLRPACTAHTSSRHVNVDV